MNLEQHHRLLSVANTVSCELRLLRSTVVHYSDGREYAVARVVSSIDNVYDALRTFIRRLGDGALYNAADEDIERVHAWLMNTSSALDSICDAIYAPTTEGSVNPAHHILFQPALNAITLALTYHNELAVTITLPPSTIETYDGMASTTNCCEVGLSQSEQRTDSTFERAATYICCPRVVELIHQISRYVASYFDDPHRVIPLDEQPTGNIGIYEGEITRYIQHNLFPNVGIDGVGSGFDIT